MSPDTDTQIWWPDTLSALDTPLQPDTDSLILKSTLDIEQNSKLTPDTQTPLHGPLLYPDVVTTNLRKGDIESPCVCSFVRTPWGSFLLVFDCQHDVWGLAVDRQMSVAAKAWIARKYCKAGNFRVQIFFAIFVKIGRFAIISSNQKFAKFSCR